MSGPGAHRPPGDRWGGFKSLVKDLPPETLAVVDKRVAKFHPTLVPALKKAGAHGVVLLQGGEKAKSFNVLQQILEAGIGLSRRGTLLCVGGGTLGDVSTVAAHVLKRGVPLIQVPSTLLAAVDSSLGGKGALDLEVKGRTVKNAMGVFHYAAASWLCPELFESLSEKQLREGGVEAWKMVLTLDAEKWRSYLLSPPSLETLIRDARGLKARVCEEDPYELKGLRRVLNFGHTFGHVLESISDFSLAHGEAVGLGMLCALDVGRALGTTSEELAGVVENALLRVPRVLPRSKLREVIGRAQPDGSTLSALLAADKKNEKSGELKMVLLRDLGRTEFVTVGEKTWKPLWRVWREGGRP